MIQLSRKSMPRLRTWLVGLCLLLALVALPVQAFAAGSGSVSGSSQKAEAGSEVTVSFSLSSNPGIWGLKGSVSYDSAVMTLKSASAGSVFSSSEILMPESMSSPFTFLASGSAIANKTGNGTLISLKFAIKSGAKLGDYPVKLSISQAIDVDEKDVSISTSAAKISVVSCVHKNTYTKDAVEATETEEGYSGDAYCSKCGILVKKGYVTPVWVNTCEHENATEWTVITQATCTEEGKQELFCPDCEHVAQEQTIPATGHLRTVVKEEKYPTTTQEGFTGNTHCETCDALLQEGTVLEKIPVVVFAMVLQPEEPYFRNSNVPLVFVSDAEFETFVRVEVDGVVLEEGAYTVESGSTRVSLTPAYLESLADGRHTVTVVSDAGTASAQFQVLKKGLDQVPNLLLLIIAIVAVLAAAGCVVYIILSRKSNNWNGRFSDTYEDDEKEE